MSVYPDSPPPDQFAAAAAGDTAAYAAILHWSAERLRRTLSRMVFAGSALEVEDLVQECLLAVHAKWHTYDTSRPYGPWLKAVARHKLTDALRRRRLHVPLEDIEQTLAADEQPEKSDLSPLLATLPDSQREAIRLTKLEELSVAQAAAQLGRSEGAIKVLVHRGLETLRRKVRAG
jgi:RNA polymerase sigma-70 factor (ECF subfamily)